MEPIGPIVQRIFRKIARRRQPMPEITVAPKEFLRYLEWRISREILPPLVPWPEAIARFGSDPIVVTPGDLGSATLSSPGGRGGPATGETSPGRKAPGT
jgi:hypothetical protein